MGWAQPMREVEFSALSVSVPQIGFGCGRLDWNGNRRQSRKLLDTALELGVRYFDTAPSYGYGTAERALGEIVADVPGVVIASKAGIAAPPKYPWVRSLMSSRLRPFRLLVPQTARRKVGDYPTLSDFDRQAVVESVERSVEDLGRPIDVLLAHEPSDPLDPEMHLIFEKLLQSGLARSVGIGTSKLVFDTDGWLGTVAQARAGSIIQPIPGHSVVLHGALRPTELGGDGSPLARLQGAVSENERSVFLVSCSTPSRLRQVVSAVS